MGTDAQSEALVDTRWVTERLTDPAVRLIEADLKPDAYAAGHLPGAVLWTV